MTAKIEREILDILNTDNAKSILSILFSDVSDGEFKDLLVKNFIEYLRGEVMKKNKKVKAFVKRLKRPPSDKRYLENTRKHFLKLVKRDVKGKAPRGKKKKYVMLKSILDITGFNIDDRKLSKHLRGVKPLTIEEVGKIKPVKEVKEEEPVKPEVKEEEPEEEKEEEEKIETEQDVKEATTFFKDLHPKNYRYMGPFTDMTKVEKFLRSEEEEQVKQIGNVKPLNQLDALALQHDLLYGSGDIETMNAADTLFINGVDELLNDPQQVKIIGGLTLRTAKNAIKGMRISRRNPVTRIFMPPSLRGEFKPKDKQDELLTSINEQYNKVKEDIQKIEKIVKTEEGRELKQLGKVVFTQDQGLVPVQFSVKKKPTINIMSKAELERDEAIKDMLQDMKKTTQFIKEQELLNITPDLVAALIEHVDPQTGQRNVKGQKAALKALVKKLGVEEGVLSKKKEELVEVIMSKYPQAHIKSFSEKLNKGEITAQDVPLLEEIDLLSKRSRVRLKQEEERVGQTQTKVQQEIERLEREQKTRDPEPVKKESTKPIRQLRKEIKVKVKEEDKPQPKPDEPETKPDDPSAVLEEKEEEEKVEIKEVVPEGKIEEADKGSISSLTDSINNLIKVIAVDTTQLSNTTSASGSADIQESAEEFKVFGEYSQSNADSEKKINELKQPEPVVKKSEIQAKLFDFIPDSLWRSEDSTFNEDVLLRNKLRFMKPLYDGEGKITKKRKKKGKKSYPYQRYDMSNTRQYQNTDQLPVYKWSDYTSYDQIQTSRGHYYQPLRRSFEIYKPTDLLFQ